MKRTRCNARRTLKRKSLQKRRKPSLKYRLMGGTCSIPGNSTWKEYCTLLPERANLFLSVLNKIHCSANPGAPFRLNYFADGQCDMVTIAILEEIKRLGKPWKFTWISGSVKGNPHIFLYDRDFRIYIDLTARQFFSEDSMATVVGTEEEMRALGYEFPVDEEEFREHLPTVVKEVRKMLGNNTT